MTTLALTTPAATAAHAEVRDEKIIPSLREIAMTASFLGGIIALAVIVLTLLTEGNMEILQSLFSPQMSGIVLSAGGLGIAVGGALGLFLHRSGERSTPLKNRPSRRQRAIQDYDFAFQQTALT